MRAHASNEAELSKSNGSAVIAAGGELYSGPAARSAVQIQAQQVQIRTAISWISTRPHPDARSISPRHRRPYGRPWPPASLHTHLAVTAIRPCAVCQSGLSPTTGRRAKLKENRTRRLPAHCTRPGRVATSAHLHPHPVHPRRERFTRDGSSLARVPNQRADPIFGAPAFRKALFCPYISWDG